MNMPVSFHSLFVVNMDETYKNYIFFLIIIIALIACKHGFGLKKIYTDPFKEKKNQFEDDG